MFTIASALCGFAPTAVLLIVARVLQAVGAAAVTPASLALVLRATPSERVPIAVAIWASMGALAAATGPTIGGLLVDWAGWRWVFFVNIPVCALAVVAARRTLVESKESDPGPFPDLVGSALLAARRRRRLAGARAERRLGVGRPAHDRRHRGRGGARRRLRRPLAPQPAPALDLSLFRIPSFRWGNVATAAFGLSFTAMFLANVTFLTSVWQYDIVKAGLAMSPGPTVVLVLARPFGCWPPASGPGR